MVAYAPTLNEWGLFYFLGELYDREKKVGDRMECRISCDLGERPAPFIVGDGGPGWDAIRFDVGIVWNLEVGERGLPLHCDFGERGQLIFTGPDWQLPNLPMSLEFGERPMPMTCFDIGERPYPLMFQGPPDGWGRVSDVLLH